MKHRRIPAKRLAITATSVAALAVAGITVQSANAGTSAQPSELSVAAASKLAGNLTEDLGADAAGVYYDAKARHLVVNVLDEDAAEQARAAGATVKVVENSAAELKGARTTLADKASIPGTAWSVDQVSNKVVVTADRTVTGAQLDKLTKIVEGLGGKAELQHSKGEFKPLIAGGDAIWGGTGRCSLGFNVIKDGAPHFLTAGHCTEGITSWSETQGGPVIGENAASSFPDNDYGLVKFTGDTAHPSEVDLYNGSSQAISGAAEATVGMQVTRSGSTTQVHDGSVTGLDATVNYGNGDIVNGLIETDVCAEPGDSGGSLFSGDKAVGLTSGGSGNCSSGGQTFFQPVTEALSATGSQIG